MSFCPVERAMFLALPCEVYLISMDILPAGLADSHGVGQVVHVLHELVAAGGSHRRQSHVLEIVGPASSGYWLWSF